jgi:hypothetical protein
MRPSHLDEHRAIDRIRAAVRRDHQRNRGVAPAEPIQRRQASVRRDLRNNHVLVAEADG